MVFSTGDKIQLEDIENIGNKFKGTQETCAFIYVENKNQNIGIIYIGKINEKEFLEDQLTDSSY